MLPTSARAQSDPLMEMDPLDLEPKPHDPNQAKAHKVAQPHTPQTHRLASIKASTNR